MGKTSRPRPYANLRRPCAPSSFGRRRHVRRETALNDCLQSRERQIGLIAADIARSVPGRAGADSASQVAHSRRALNRLASRNSPHSSANPRHSLRLSPKQKPPCPVQERARRIRSLFRQGAAILSIAGCAAARRSDVAIDAKAGWRMTVNLLARDVIGRPPALERSIFEHHRFRKQACKPDNEHACSPYCMHNFTYACT